MSPRIDAGLLQALEDLVRGQEYELQELGKRLDALRANPLYGSLAEYFELRAQWDESNAILARSREDLALLRSQYQRPSGG